MSRSSLTSSNGNNRTLLGSTLLTSRIFINFFLATFIAHVQGGKISTES